MDIQPHLDDLSLVSFSLLHGGSGNMAAPRPPQTTTTSTTTAKKKKLVVRTPGKTPGSTVKRKVTVELGSTSVREAVDVVLQEELGDDGDEEEEETEEEDGVGFRHESETPEPGE